MKWFYDLKMARRLMVLNLVAALALAAVTGFGIFQMGRVYHAASYASENTVPSFVVLDSALKAYDAMTLLTSKHVAATDPQKMQQIEQQIAEQRNALRTALERYESLIYDQNDRDMLAADRAGMAQSVQIRDQVLALSRANQKPQAAELLDGSLTDAAQRFDTAIEAHRG